jgi:hypothetical protein
MSRSAILLMIAGGAILIVVAGLFIGGTPGEVAAGKETTQQPPAIAERTPAEPLSLQVGVPSPDGTRPTRQQLESADPSAGLLTNWEDQVEEILSSQDPQPDKARRLLELFSRLPEVGQVEVAQELSHLVPDSNFASLGQYLTNSTTAEGVGSILMAGLLDRPNSLRMPWLLQVARDEQNARAGEARNWLQTLMGQDYGNDWTKWETEVQKWLEDNPD